MANCDAFQTQMIIPRLCHVRGQEHSARDIVALEICTQNVLYKASVFIPNASCYQLYYLDWIVMDLACILFNAYYINIDLLCHVRGAHANLWLRIVFRELSLFISYLLLNQRDGL